MASRAQGRNWAEVAEVSDIVEIGRGESYGWNCGRENDALVSCLLGKVDLGNMEH